MTFTAEVIRTERCAAAFERISWAFLFFYFDVRIGGGNVQFDVLPDFVGWVMVASALSSIVDLSSAVRGIRTLSYWLVFLSLFDLLEVRMPMGQAGSFDTWIAPTFPILMAVAILDAILFWRLCGLIIDMSLVTGNAAIAERAAGRRKLYVALVAMGAVSFWISFVVPLFLPVAFLAGLPLAVVVLCLMVGLMRGTARMCRDQTV